jgi:hypothetical protein
MDEARAARLGHNQSVMRTLNDELTAGQLASQASPLTEQCAFMCECSDLGCLQLVSVSVEKYSAVRRDARRFFVHPGHEIPEIEAVVERAAGYFVVEKTGAAKAAVAEDGAY